MISVQEAKKTVMENLTAIKDKMNEILSGGHLDEISPILTRIDYFKHLPQWFEVLKDEGRLPNLDGKTVGSILEKLLVCVLEKYIFNSEVELSVNPARGVDIPQLELGVKSPSTNYCTSEPYFSAYDRLLGNEFDAIILLTNYQDAKRVVPFKLQILQVKYLYGSEIADGKLCAVAKAMREKYTDKILLQKTVRFLSYINQSDWEANSILRLIQRILIKERNLSEELEKIKKDFYCKNGQNEREGKPLIPKEALDRLLALEKISPVEVGILGAAENWVILTQKDNGRFPNENEWQRFCKSPLNGKIGMSFALQWRYNFRTFFHN